MHLIRQKEQNENNYDFFEKDLNLGLFLSLYLAFLK